MLRQVFSVRNEAFLPLEDIKSLVCFEEKDLSALFEKFIERGFLVRVTDVVEGNLFVESLSFFQKLSKIFKSNANIKELLQKVDQKWTSKSFLEVQSGLIIRNLRDTM